jgi:hypothetical protein
MAATYRHIAQRRAREASYRERWRNRLTGGVILAAVLLFAVYAGGGAFGRLPSVRLRKIGTNAQGRPVYAPEAPGV